MKKIAFAFFAVLCLAALSLAPPAAHAEPGSTPNRIRVGYFAFSNFHDVDTRGNYSGYGYDYLQEIAKYTGWQYEYIFASWDECLDLLAKGEIDLLASAQRTEDRVKAFDFARLDSGISYAVLCATDKNKELAYEDFQAFDGMKVGLLKGNSRNAALTEYCLENNFTVQIRMFNNQRDLLSALHTGYVDAILTSNLRKDPRERVIARFAPSPFFFITTKGNQSVLKPLNSALTRIKLANPHFDAELYQEHYGVEKSDQPVFTRSERDFIKSHPQLTVVCNPYWTPISFWDDKNEDVSGIMQGVLQHVAENTGLTLNFVFATDITQAVQMLERGKADIIGAVQRSYRFPGSSAVIVGSSYLSGFTVMVTDPQAATTKNDKIAITEDDWHSYPNAVDEPRLIRFPKALDCFEALLRGDVSALYANAYQADQLRADYRFSRFQLTAMPNLKNELGMAVLRSEDPRLLSILNRSLEYLSQEELQDIILKNTIVAQKLSIRDYVYQNPVAAIAGVATFLLIIIAFLGYLAFIRLKNNKKVYHLLYVDDLTGIWNFNYFLQTLKRLLTSDKKTRYAVTCMDIERFKDINETLGYAQGDLILQNIARLLRENTSDDELYARISNDNFIILLRYDDEKAFAERIDTLYDIFNRIPKNEHEYFKLMLTSGTCVIRENDNAPAVIVDGANDARKTVKGRHKSAHSFYNEHLRNALLAQREIEAVMEQALETGQFVAFYQPKVDLKTTEIIGAEALVRWQHPQRGLVPPFQFIPLFEKNGFIVEVDFFIFENVCKTIRRQLDSGKKPVPISSNFSRIHFTRPGFISRLKNVAERYQIPPQLLELEITESMMDENAEALLAVLNELRLHKFHIAMDDFGSGYSSLNLLKTMPLDTLKMDKDFLQKGIVSEKERIIIAGFVEIAKKLKFKVLCEGVETQEQASFLRSIGCDYAQGYLYAKPLPLPVFEARLYDGVTE